MSCTIRWKVRVALKDLDGKQASLGLVKICRVRGVKMPTILQRNDDFQNLLWRLHQAYYTRRINICVAVRLG